MTDTGRPSFVFIAAGVTALALVSAYAMRWYCDDIFITLRYARQFLDGNGFVYNAGERVQGYTHFLWLLILTAADAAGLDPLETSMYAGVLAHAGTVLLLALASYRMVRARGLGGPVVPFAALAVAVNTECTIWATSGLETAFFTFLVTAAFFVYFFARRTATVRTFAAATLLTMAVMTRPDGIVFYAVAGMLVAARAVLSRGGGRPVRDAVVFLAPFVLLYMPYAIWKVSYYGSVFPNTYYAKSAYLAYWGQGAYYLWLYARAYPTSLLCLAAVPVLAVAFVRERRRAATGPGVPEQRNHMPSDRAAAAAALAGTTAYLVFFVARVGGDFMFARFVVPVLPFVYWLVEWSATRVMARRARARAVVFVLLALAIVTVEKGLRDDLLIDASGAAPTVRDHRGVVDEHFYYTRVYPLAAERRAGEALRPYFDGLDAAVLLRGQACLGYYAGFETCIENGGLTDAFIARLPLSGRGRVGHEHSAPYSYLLEREVNFLFNRRPLRPAKYRMARFDVDGMSVWAEIITWDAALMRELSRRLGGRLQFTPFERYLDRYIEEVLPSLPLEQVRADFAEFSAFYFDYNDDPARRAAFEERLRRGATGRVDGPDSDPGVGEQ